MRILVVFGTRPEAVKLAPVIQALKREPGFSTKICVTAQHRQMLDQVLHLFDISPDSDLNLMQEDQTLFQITARALLALQTVFETQRPNLILMQGDTTTAFVAALAGYYLKIRIGHVEAGLRTGDRFNPFPEEINRRLGDALSDLCFAPTERARQNLLREGLPDERIFVTGNTVIDALQATVRLQATDAEQTRFEAFFRDRYHLTLRGRLILVTGHRRESFGPEFESICEGLRMIAQHNGDVQIVYPVHLNPNVQRPVRRILGRVPRVHLIDPQDYAPFVWLLSRSYLVLTDSGGVQEEAPALGKPVLVMRKVTERPEGVEAGVARLVGTEAQSIAEGAQRLLDDQTAYTAMARAVNPYGDGHAAERIVGILRRHAST